MSPRFSPKKGKADGLTLTSLRRRRWREAFSRRFKVIAAAAAAAVLVGYLLYFSPWLRIHHVAIRGEQLLSEADVRAAAKVPLDVPLIKADLGKVRQRLTALPAVASVSVSRSWPQTVSISVTERTPVAVASTAQGLQYIDATGAVFGSLKAQPPGLPVIVLNGSVDRSALLNAATIAASLPSAILSQVTSITVRTMDDIQLDMSGGRWIQWGNSNDSATKAQVAADLLNQKAAHIDVSVPSNPVTQ